MNAFISLLVILWVFFVTVSPILRRLYSFDCWFFIDLMFLFIHYLVIFCLCIHLPIHLFYVIIKLLTYLFSLIHSNIYSCNSFYIFTTYLLFIYFINSFSYFHFISFKFSFSFTQLCFFSNTSWNIKCTKAISDIILCSCFKPTLNFVKIILTIRRSNNTNHFVGQIVLFL